MKTILYIDGFNLFYSALKGAPLRWLNPVTLINRAFPRNQIIGTKYFTARVSPLPGNPGQPIRQMMYWRALRTLSNLEIIEGDFRTRKVMAAVVSPPNFPQTADLVRILNQQPNNEPHADELELGKPAVGPSRAVSGCGEILNRTNCYEPNLPGKSKFT